MIERGAPVDHQDEVVRPKKTIAQSVDGNGITNFNLSPNVGYFIIDDLAIGGQLILEAQNGEGDFNDATSFGFTPFVRYYFAGAGAARFFGQGRLGFGSEKRGDFDAEPYFTFGLGAGVDFSSTTT